MHIHCNAMVYNHDHFDGRTWELIKTFRMITAPEFNADVDVDASACSVQPITARGLHKHCNCIQRVAEVAYEWQGKCSVPNISGSSTRI